jgi:hypothetical protein
VSKASILLLQTFSSLVQRSIKEALLQGNSLPVECPLLCPLLQKTYQKAIQSREICGRSQLEIGAAILTKSMLVSDSLKCMFSGKMIDLEIP